MFESQKPIKKMPVFPSSEHPEHARNNWVRKSAGKIGKIKGQDEKTLILPICRQYFRRTSEVMT